MCFARQAFLQGPFGCGIGLGVRHRIVFTFLRALNDDDFRKLGLQGHPASGSHRTRHHSDLHFGMNFHNIRDMDMEGWNEAVTSWLGSLLWAPHSVALVAGPTGFLLVFHATMLDRSRQRLMTAALAGILLATMLGDSIYVGLVMAVFLTLWTVTHIFCRMEKTHGSADARRNRYSGPGDSVSAKPSPRTKPGAGDSSISRSETFAEHARLACQRSFRNPGRPTYGDWDYCL